MERIKQIAKQLIEIAKQINLTSSLDNSITLDCIFNNAVKIYLSEVIQENKQNNIKAYQNKPEVKPIDKPMDRPSEKQIALLKQFKVKYIDKLTKQDATQLIKQKIQEQNEY